eukprot:c10938_g1_i2.p1 GENE.c10938_g1_i2~~c10938_g1_i2.p1  ORF type:complete len:308 (+),score=63.14 c10938_g1_i2:803-1726(+)
MMVGLGLTNAAAAVVALYAALLHFSRLRPGRFAFTTPTGVIVSRTMAGGSVLLCVECVIRAVYCAMGPVNSTAAIMYRDHMYLTYVSLGLNLMPTLLAVSLFLRWGAFGKPSWVKRHLEKFLVFAGVMFFFLTIVLATFEANFLAQVELVVTLASAFGLICLSAASLAFIIAGTRFTRSLQASKVLGNNADRNRSRHKAVIWITWSGVAHLLQIIGSAIAVFPEISFSPPGYFLLYALIFYGMSLAALFEAIAFVPKSRKSDVAVVDKSTPILPQEQSGPAVDESNVVCMLEKSKPVSRSQILASDV